MITRRTLAASLLATPALATPALATPALAQTTSFVVATFGGLFEQTLREHVIPGFEKGHGVRVQLELGTGSTFIPKLLASPRRPPFDVVHLNDDEAYLGDALGLWAPTQPLPHLAEIAPTLRPDRVPMYASIVYELPLVYRTDRMTAPTAWADLWTAAAAGRTIGIPHISNSYGLTFLLIAAQLHGGSEKDLSPAFPALQRLGSVKVFRGVTQGHSMFQQGEIDAGLFYGHRAQQLADQGIPVAAVAPTEGLWGQRTGLQIPRAARNPELSRAWADLTLAAPYQQAFAAGLYSPTNTTVQVPDALRPKLVLGEARVGRLRWPDWSAINPQRDALLTRWTQTFGG